MKKLTIVFAALLASLTFVPAASSLSIADGEPPDGKVGEPYFYQFRMREGSGSYPMTWIVPHSGIFPPGLRTIVSGDTRTLTVLGTPTVAGIYNFYIQVQDAPGPWTCCTEVPYRIPIHEATTPPPGGGGTVPTEADLTASQLPYTGPYYGPTTNKPKRKGNTALALKLVMRNLGYEGFGNPDRHYNLNLQTAMQDFQRKRGIRPTGDYGKLS